MVLVPEVVPQIQRQGSKLLDLLVNIIWLTRPLYVIIEGDSLLDPSRHEVIADPGVLFELLGSISSDDRLKNVLLKVRWGQVESLVELNFRHKVEHLAVLQQLETSQYRISDHLVKS